MFRQWLAAILVFTTPVFVVLYVLTVPDGPWHAVLAVHIFAAVVVALISSAYSAAAIWVDPTGIAERGFFGVKREYPIARIGSVVLARTFDASDDGSAPQLFVRDKDGKRLVRMRGQFWSQGDMDRVVSSLDVPFTLVGEDVSTTELAEDYPGLPYWFEQHPVLTALLFSVGLAILGGLFFFVLTATRLTC